MVNIKQILRMCSIIYLLSVLLTVKKITEAKHHNLFF